MHRMAFLQSIFAAVVALAGDALTGGLSAQAESQVVQPIEWQPARESSAAMPTGSTNGNVVGPLAILVRNPGLSPGEPTYALADQSGAIQRLVEPARGADLESRVGQTVRVRHDTGRTLLSSQIEFAGAENRVTLAAFEGRSGGSRRPARLADASSSRVEAEEIAVPGESEPIWRDEMEMATAPSQGGRCNCERCRAAHGEPFGGDSFGPDCTARGGFGNRFGNEFGWDCCICDALFGRGRSQCRNEWGPGDCCEPGFSQFDSACGDACSCELCGSCDRWTRVNPGVFGSIELLLLRGYDSEPDTQSSTHETGGRFTLGYLNNSGRSWRFRYFRIDLPDFDNGRDLNLRYFDLDYAGRFSLGCNWHGELSGGLRWSRVYDQEDNRYDPAFGPVIGAELRGPCCLGCDLYGIARQSFQYGEEKNDNSYGTFAISEVQFGTELQRQVNHGTGFARAFLEAQSWQGVEDNDSEDVGLFGFGFALGLTR